MYLKKLLLRNFRNYSEVSVDFCNGINYIYGNNAQGKTNLLEAIYFLIIGRSFRSRNLLDIVKDEEEYFYLEAIFDKDGVENVLKFSYNEHHNYIIYNDTYLRSNTDILGLMQGTILVPEDVDIVKGSPSHRRRFLDINISQRDRSYLKMLIRYHRALKQRNYLLKSHSSINIESWELELARAASEIVYKRYGAIINLSEATQNCYSHISAGLDKVELFYKNNFTDKLIEGCEIDDLCGLYFKRYASGREREYIMGKTLFGPQCDDFKILINDHEAKSFGSEGQQRSLVVAMRMGEWNALARECNQPPIIAVDDFGIGMDYCRKQNFYEDLSSTGQLFITSTEAPTNFDNLGKDFLGLKVVGGIIKPVN